MSSPRIFIAGAGRQSVAAGCDLLRFSPRSSLTLADASLGQAEASAERIRYLVHGADIEVLQLDASDTRRASEAMKAHDAVAAGVPYFLNPKVHAAAREAGLPSLDMGSDLPDLEAVLGKRSDAHSTCAVFDSGLAPGLGNQLARHLITSLPRTLGARIYCGGLPLDPRTPLRYKPRFSLEGLVGEYSDPAVALKDGVVVELASLSELEEVKLPEFDALEAFVTSGGASIGPHLYAGKLEDYEYKTLRFPGHCQAMRAYRDLGLWSHEPLADGTVPFEVFERLFSKATEPEDDRDQVVLLVEAWNAGEKRRLFVRHSFDPVTRLSAMEQLTGFSASIVLQEMLRRDPEPGLYAAEELVSGQTMVEELAKRGIEVIGI